MHMTGSGNCLGSHASPERSLCIPTTTRSIKYTRLSRVHYSMSRVSKAASYICASSSLCTDTSFSDTFLVRGFLNTVIVSHPHTPRFRAITLVAPRNHGYRSKFHKGDTSSAGCAAERQRCSRPSRCWRRHSVDCFDVCPRSAGCVRSLAHFLIGTRS